MDRVAASAPRFLCICAEQNRFHSARGQRDFGTITMSLHKQSKDHTTGIILCALSLFLLFPLDAFATDNGYATPFHPTTLIVAIIALFLPPAVMVTWRRHLSDEVHYGKSILKEYLSGLLVLNILTIVIVCIVYSTTWRSLVFYAYDFPSHYAHKLNEVGKFIQIRDLVWQHINTIGVLLYMALAIVIGFLVPLASKKIALKSGGLDVDKANVIRKTISISYHHWTKFSTWLVNTFGYKRRFRQNIIITIVLAVILFTAGSFKSGYHLDEMYTFGLANNDREPDLDDWTIYDGEYIWHDYLTVPVGGSFDYVNLYVEQAYDCHPPIYYILIHTVSSLFPFLSILLIGLLVHVPLACIVFWQLVWIGRKLGIRRITAVIVAASYVLGMGFFNEGVVFFRMYGLLSIWANFLVMVFLQFPARSKGTTRYYIAFGLALLGGLLTHYYFVVFACFTCLVYAFSIASYKNREKLIKSVYTAVCTIVLWLSIYPFALLHILWSTRGSESFDNLGAQSLMSCFIDYAKLIDTDIFGHLLIVLVATIVCLGVGLICISSRRVAKVSKDRIAPYLFMIIPFAFYVLVIAKVAPYQTLRYVLEGCGIFYIALFAIIDNLGRRIHNKLKTVTRTFALIVLVLGYISNGFLGLRLVENDNIASLSEYENSLCLYYYGTEEQNKPHRHKLSSMIMNFHELRHMRKIMIVDGIEWRNSEKINYTGGSIVVYITNPPKLETNHEDILSHLKQKYELSESERLFSYGYSKTYVVK